MSKSWCKIQEKNLNWKLFELVAQYAFRHFLTTIRRIIIFSYVQHFRKLSNAQKMHLYNKYSSNSWDYKNLNLRRGIWLVSVKYNVCLRCCKVNIKILVSLHTFTNKIVGSLQQITLPTTQLGSHQMYSKLYYILHHVPQIKLFWMCLQFY